MTQAANDAWGADQLRARLGKGARHDAPGAPAEALHQARRGMAFFARQLNTVPEDGLAKPSLIPGWHRAHLVAHVSLSARAQALAFAALRGQVSDEDEDWSPDIDLAATLPARALRHLFEHAHVHVNVEWRDTTSAGWNQTIDVPPAGPVATRELPAHHAGLLWWGAVALNAAATEDEIPKTITCPAGPLQTMVHRRGDTIPGQSGKTRRPEN